MSQKIIIVGGVAGGMSAATRLRRLSETAAITIYERSGNVSFANCGLPYYLGREIPKREHLVLQTPQSLNTRFNLEVKVLHEVVAIDTAAKQVQVKNLETGDVFSDAYDELILSVGASPICPPLPGLQQDGVFTLRNMEDVDAIDAWMDAKQPKRALVAGCGFIGLEVAEQLKERGLEVTLIDASPQVLRPLDAELAERIHTEIRQHGVDLRLAAAMKALHPISHHSVEGEAAPLLGWVEAGDMPLIATDMVILGIGVRPETALAKQAGVAIGERGGIAVNAQLQTSQPHIWAVGDAIEVVNPLTNAASLVALGGPANRQGRQVANSVMGLQDAYEGTLGTAIIRVFSLTAAATGLNEAQLQQLGYPYEALHLHPKNHAGYYPGSELVALKVLFNPETGALYGGQAVGKAGIDKRIDVLATALKAKLSIRDLAELELCYAPPFGSAKDPINLAGMMGENILDGLLAQVQWHQLPQLDMDRHVLLDVRDDNERAAGHIEGSLHIPLCQLRDKASSLPKDKIIVVYCQSGQRSYFGTRVLNLLGFEAKNLSGAYLTYRTRPDACCN